jgi:signal transduction histidine kinase
LALLLGAGPSRADAAELTRAAQVRELSQDEAAAKRPVRLRGTWMGEAEPDGAGILRDGSSGIYLLGRSEHFASLAPGDRIEVVGETDPGGYAPIVRVTGATRLGPGELPAPTRVAADRLLSGAFDAEWVELEGVVRSVEPVWWTTTKSLLVLATGGQRLSVQVNAALPPDEWIDSVVRVRGFCFYRSNRNRQALTPHLLVPKDEALERVSPPPGSLAETVPVPVANLFRFDPRAHYGHRVRIAGTVLHSRRGESLWLRDGDRGLHIRSGQTNRVVMPGDFVEVTGFPNRGGYTPILEDAVYRRVRSDPPPEPHPVASMADALKHDADLVSVEARLTELRQSADGWALGLDLGDRVVRGLVALPTGFSPLSEWRVGSRVRAKGICTVLSENADLGSGVLEPDTFQLLLRSPFDLEIVEAPSWWTPARIIRLLFGVALGLAGVAGWIVVAARLRLREQEARRRTAEAEFAAMLAERSRIAREIHDTLAQGLGAISMHLELVKHRMPEAPDEAGKHLAIAHDVARGSLAEARRSIWNMRSQALEKRSLAEALKDVVEQVRSGDTPATEFEVAGKERRLSAALENSLLRVGQEAITNALRHSGAARVTVRLEFAERAVRLRVEDDGKGFDPEHPPASEGGFGLIGIRERVAEVGGQVVFESAPGRGTKLTVEAPMPTVEPDGAEDS